ncbi:MAG TPA: alginate lyase family protein [Steroidobacteraceae bacterium]|nr:alginate lyase family protein [Steroidobacteraceae bacterium]
MQSLSWYVHRLAHMSGAELAHRLRGTTRAAREWLIPEQDAPAPAETVDGRERRFIHVPTELDAAPYVRQAERLITGRHAIFHLDSCDLGNPPEWNRDPLTGRLAPLRHAHALDHRDARRVGNIKYLWEPNRHLHLVTLAQAYALSGDLRYSHAVRQHIESWIEQCPVGRGPNWSSPLELAIRLINWSVAWQLLGGERAGLLAGSDGRQFRERWLRSVYLHVRTIVANPSRFSSANNHLIGEMAGVWIAAVTWPHWPRMREWGARARRILQREILAQNASDGGNREQAIAYQQFVLDFFLLAGLAARAIGEDFSAQYWQRVESMIQFLASLMDVAGNVPMIGDADDGYVVQLAPRESFNPYRSLIATGALLFGRPDFALKARELDAKSRWLQGDADARFQTLLARAPAHFEPTRAFAQSGYYLLGRDLESPDEIRLLIDAGSLGYLSLAAHGHADALGILLNAGGREILVDPGTYAYHTDPDWRHYFRSTRAHNCVVIDGEDQSVQSGKFMWSRHARACCNEFASADGRQGFAGEHDGYRRLRDPVVHRRAVLFDEASGSFEIADTFHCRGAHRVCRHWHFAETLEVTAGNGGFSADAGRYCVTLVPLEPLEGSQLIRGGTPEQGGWISRGFGRKQPCASLAWVSHINGPTTLRTRIVCDPRS